MRQVWLDELPPEQLPSEVYAKQKSALQAIATALQGNEWVELATEDEKFDAQIDYQVRVNAGGEYEICDRMGAAFKNIELALNISSPNAPKTLVKHLVHLTKYHAVEELDNYDEFSPLHNKLSVEWLGKLKQYDSEDGIPQLSQLEPLDNPYRPTINLGEWIFLRIRNEYATALNVAALNLSSDWSIEQVYPGG